MLPCAFPTAFHFLEIGVIMIIAIIRYLLSFVSDSSTLNVSFGFTVQVDMGQCLQMEGGSVDRLG